MGLDIGNRKKRKKELGKLRKRRRERNPKETTSSCSFAPLCLATMACSSAPSLSVLAALLLSLGIALVLPQLVVCVATMTHSKGPQNFDPSLSTPTLTYEYEKGVFAEALLNGPVDKVNNWRTAMTEAANLAGFHLEHRPEPEFIEEIVEIIWKILYEESPTSTIPPCRQNDVPGQCSSLIIPQKGALSGQNAIAQRANPFFFFPHFY
ncbi:hypothetical protein CMV_011790 [Castanea mollissima]|uniref:Uncharacterized protein n=1 Tax=Castanea mollissima TaxID=60419 RepID=A0A8J4VWN4_9ROSI|nr:hypothetical protein CMV_011790 [Castanea mollissima]